MDVNIILCKKFVDVGFVKISRIKPVMLWMFWEVESL